MDEEKIEYEKIEVDRDNKPEEVTSTGGTVPVIKDGNIVMSESAEIIEYLKKKFNIEN